MNAVGAQNAMARLRSDMGVVEVRPADLRRHYSLARAIQYAGSRDKDAAAPASAFEVIVDEEYARAGYQKRSLNSVLVPMQAVRRHLASGLRAAQPYQTTEATAGQELVENTLESAMFIDALRPLSRVLRLGATVVGGLRGDIVLPRQDTTTPAYWLTASGTPQASQAITEAEATFDSTQLKFAPAQIGTYSTISRLLTQQGGELGERIIAGDMAKSIATAVDLAAIQGTGSSGQPTGITNLGGTNAVSGTTLGLAGLVSAVQQVCAANAVTDPGSLGWVAPPATAGLLTQRFEASSNVNRLWRGDLDSGIVEGLPAYSTTNAPAATMIFGCWWEVILASWGENPPLEVEVAWNPYGGNFAGGDYQVRAMLSCNIVVRHAAAFSVISSIT
jgi:HK97 family phage major capsid protein